MSKPTIGFVGLGAMGFGMATHLVKEGYPVHGFDVFAASVDRFKAAGGMGATSLRESAEGKSYYVCMVASAPQAQSALFDEGGIVDGTLVFIVITLDYELISLSSSSQKRHPTTMLHGASVLRPLCSIRAPSQRPRRHQIHRQPRLRRSHTRRGRDIIHYGWRIRRRA